MIKKEKYYKYIKELNNAEEVHKMKYHVQHGKSSTYDHCVKVTHYSYILARKLKLKIDYKSLTRGAFLHDFFLYDWHIKDDGHNLHAFTHPKRAAKNANKHFVLNKKEINIIESHMWPLTINKIPKSKEAFIVCFVDKFCAIIEIIKIKNEIILKQ